MICEATSTISVFLLLNLTFLSLPFMHNCRSLILLFRHINQISSKNYKHLLSNSYLYPLQILLCLLAVTVKSVSSHFLKYIMCFVHSQMSSLRCLFESPYLPSLLSPLYFQDIFLIRKKKTTFDRINERSLNLDPWIDYSGAALRHRSRWFPQPPTLLLHSSRYSYLMEIAPKWHRKMEHHSAL